MNGFNKEMVLVLDSCFCDRLLSEIYEYYVSEFWT